MRSKNVLHLKLLYYKNGVIFIVLIIQAPDKTMFGIKNFLETCIELIEKNQKGLYYTCKA